MTWEVPDAWATSAAVTAAPGAGSFATEAAPVVERRNGVGGGGRTHPFPLGRRVCRRPIGSARFKMPSPSPRVHVKLFDLRKRHLLHERASEVFFFRAKAHFGKNACKRNDI